MTIERAKVILRFLAEGADPLTGEVLPEDSVCNKAEIVRAFYCILNELESKKKSPTKETPENAGKPWTKEDDRKLISMFESGCTKKEMSSYFHRSSGGIEARLVRLGKIENKYTPDFRK